MNPIYVRYPEYTSRPPPKSGFARAPKRPEYLEIIPTNENMTVQDILDYIISIYDDYLEETLIEKQFSLGYMYPRLDINKCSDFLELYDNKENALESINPLPREMYIRDIPRININDTRDKLWYNLDGIRCIRYLTDLQMAQKRRSFAVASILPENIQENIFRHIPYDIVDSIAPKIKRSEKINKSRGMGPIPFDLQDYNMDQTYSEFLEDRRRGEELRKLREKLRRERDEEFEEFRNNLEIYYFLKDIEDPQYGGKKKKTRKKRKYRKRYTNLY